MCGAVSCMGSQSTVAVFLENALTRWHFLPICDHLSDPPTHITVTQDLLTLPLRQDVL